MVGPPGLARGMVNTQLNGSDYCAMSPMSREEAMALLV